MNSSPLSLDEFYRRLLRRLRRAGVPCAITGGLACVEFGVVEHTEDCDLVAEMKRTRRRKDWDQATALGLQLVKSGESEGWLHIFDAEALARLTATVSCPRRLLARRPVLRLALENDRWLDRAVRMEVEFWSHLDRLRLKVYETGGRDYALAVMKDKQLKRAPLCDQHALRVDYASRLLPKHPLRQYGLERLVAEAREATMMGLDPALAKFLPDVTLHFANLRV